MCMVKAIHTWIPCIIPMIVTGSLLPEAFWREWQPVPTVEWVPDQTLGELDHWTEDYPCSRYNIYSITMEMCFVGLRRICSQGSLKVIIGASEASPFLVFNVAICLSVCMYVCMSWTTGRHNNFLLGLVILYQLQSSFAHPKHALHAPSYGA